MKKVNERTKELRNSEKYKNYNILLYSIDFRTKDKIQLTINQLKKLNITIIMEHRLDYCKEIIFEINDDIFKKLLSQSKAK